MAKKAPLRRPNYCPARLSVRVSRRTHKQWRKCLMIGRLTGTKGDRLIARAIRLVTVRLQQECHAAGIDWRTAFDSDELGMTVDANQERDSRKPMIHE